MNYGTPKVVSADSLEWLSNFDGHMEAVYTGIPDAAEVGLDIESYAVWFDTVMEKILEKTSSDGFVIIQVTDRKAGGKQFSKSNRILNAADRKGWSLLWHKIVLKRKPGSTDLMRVSYSHLICLSVSRTVGRAFPDVIESGSMWYKNGTGENSVTLVGEYLVSMGVGKAYDLFCGRGTVGYIFSLLGIDTVNIDIDADQVEETRKVLSSLPRWTLLNFNDGVNDEY